MFQANLVQAVSHYPLSKLVPQTIGNDDDEGLFDYVTDSLVEGNLQWSGADDTLSLVEPKLFRRYLMTSLDAGNFNLAAPEIEDLLMTLDTLMLRDIHISLGE